MGYIERDGGSRTSGPVLGGAMPFAQDGALPAMVRPSDLATLFSRRPPAIVAFQGAVGTEPHRVSVNGGNAVFTPEAHTTQERQFTTNPTLDAVCKIIQTTTPNWSKLTRQLTQTESRRQNGRHGLLAELLVDDVIDGIISSGKFGDLTDATVLDNKVTPHYIFRREGKKNLVAWKRGHSLKSEFARATEYDRLLLINGLPTVVEVKAKNDASHGTNPLNDSLRFAHAATIFNPLQEAFGTNTFAFVVITLPERISAESKLQQDFKNKGGILIPMRANYEELLFYAGQSDLPSRTNHQHTGRRLR